MNKPNISKAEADQYIKNAAACITRSMNQLVIMGRIGQEEAQQYLQKATAPIGSPVLVLAIRGYYLNSLGASGENDRGVYDDAMILIGPNYYQTFNANTDPRKHEKGIAMLLPGWHSFKQGWHGYGKASGHKAFRTANPDEVSPVLRDGQIGIQKGFTINLHSGGFNNTNSAGCQTVYKGQWLEFQQAAYKLMNAEGQKILPYLLLEEKFK
jgi:lysozyme